MHKIKHNKTKREKRKLRVSSKIYGTPKKLRLSVFRSNKHIYLQVINDVKGETLLAYSDLNLTKKAKKGKTKLEKSALVAKKMAEKLKKEKIKRLVFDRGHYQYHGRVKKIVEVLRKESITI